MATEPRVLIGTRPDPAAGRALIELVRESQRSKQDSGGNAIARVRALAGDPHVHAVGALIAEANRRDHASGGRPLTFPDWCLVLFGAAIRIFGSASATGRALQEPVLWQEVLRAAEPYLAANARPKRGPSRDHWTYFVRGRVSDSLIDDLVVLQSELGIRRAREVGLLNEDDPAPTGRYRRDHVVGLDGKVFSSPVRTLETERVDRLTGELRPVRQDPARQRYGEGGVDGIVWGTKFAIASVRSPMANHRVIVGISHFDSDTPGGEGRVFTDLAKELAHRAAGIHAFTADGAWRGTHLSEIQATTGKAVITPGRHLSSRKGGITIGRQSFAAKPLPWSERRADREAVCGGHQLWACAGTIFEEVINSEGRSEFVELTRHQTKKDSTRRKSGTAKHQFYARYSLPCAVAGSAHDWWEPLLPVPTDTSTKFNRCEYLRVVPTTSDEHQRLYGMRQDTESLNAQLERAFYGQRLPAWGVSNQTLVVLLAAIAENAWAKCVWERHVRDDREARLAR